MTALEDFFIDLSFRLSTLTWFDMVDLLLVMGLFYLFIYWAQQSLIAFLLRGILLFSVVLLGVLIFLPLRTFEWMVRFILLGFLITLPVIFHLELRRLLERLGRNIGLRRAARQSATKKVLSALGRAVEKMAATHTGALIVLEGNQPLDQIIETGIRVSGEVTSELLEAIFYLGNPLHDGAVVIRGDQIVAASCLLPLTERSISAAHRRLGTRHRAGVGMSEKSDALVIVVSEETGEIATAIGGELLKRQELVALREQIVRFGDQTSAAPVLSRSSFFSRAKQKENGRPTPWRVMAGHLVFAFLLALMVWWFVLEFTVPIPHLLIEEIPMEVIDLPPNMKLSSPLPKTISAIVQTTNETAATLSAYNFDATLSLAEREPGHYQLPITVVSRSEEPVEVLSVEPATLDVQLVAVVTRSFPVGVNLLDQERLTAAYTIVDEPTANPDQVQVSGPQPLIEQISQIEAAISVAGGAASLQERRTLRALDENGKEITGLTIEPKRTEVTVNISRRQNARDVGVRVITTGEVPSDYWLSGLYVNLSTVTLNGPPKLLSDLGGFVNTLSVDISQSLGDFTTDIPLDLPEGVIALAPNGEQLGTVAVSVELAARQSDLVLTRPVELVASKHLTVTVEPPYVTLLLSGAVPILKEIEADPDLVHIWLDANDLEATEAERIAPQVILPKGIEAQVVPPLLLLTTSSDAQEETDGP